jgi:hypothetical protein
MSWHEANQHELARALDAVRDALRRHAQRRTPTPPDPSAATPSHASSASPPADFPSALAQLVTTFRLSRFERDVLLLCAGVELDATFGPLCAAANGDPAHHHATFGLALAALPGAHWSALTPAAPLRRWRLVEVNGAALTTSPLRIDERILNYLAGVPHPDERLAGLITPVHHAHELPPSHQIVAARIAALWQPSERGELTPVVQLCGDGTFDKRAIAADACARVGLGLHALAADLIPAAPGELQTLSRLLEREGALTGSALLIEFDDERAEASTPVASARLTDRMAGPVLIATRERRPAGRRPSVAFDVSKPTPAEQRAVWHNALGGAAVRLNGQVEQMVTQFNLSTDLIRAACTDAVGRLQSTEPAGGVTTSALSDDHAPDTPDLAATVWESCRVQARVRMDELAQRIGGAPTWNDLVLPDAQRQILHDIAAHVRHRTTVYERWGFAKQGSRGLGITALFAGASGTGKTMAAEVLAGELRLDLYRIDLSTVVSKYIGETEKNLRRIFDAAEAGGAILLFDEADALFGKRSEVKDSHDRYANIEVSYLLQRMEAYRGLAILTTNLKSALDTAFLRRIRFIVQFPFPDAEQRAEIWQRVFPRETPVDGVRTELLAQLNLAGGNIRSVALNAAFLAADADEPVRMSHLLRAARSEYAKLERPLTEAETAGWG